MCSWKTIIYLYNNNNHYSYHH